MIARGLARRDPYRLPVCRITGWALANRALGMTGAGARRSGDIDQFFPRDPRDVDKSVSGQPVLSPSQGRFIPVESLPTAARLRSFVLGGGMGTMSAEALQ